MPPCNACTDHRRAWRERVATAVAGTPTGRLRAVLAGGLLQGVVLSAGEVAGAAAPCGEEDARKILKALVAKRSVKRVQALGPRGQIVAGYSDPRTAAAVLE